VSPLFPHFIQNRADGRNAAHAAFTIIREEGLATLYRGVTLTALRQATNQGQFTLVPSISISPYTSGGMLVLMKSGVNFTAYQKFKQWASEYQPQYEGNLPSWQTMIMGLISGAMGPFSNAPIDTIKT
jgi:solute carrier family 25 citrate transporter 1